MDRGRQDGGGVCGQRVRAEHADGLSDSHGCRGAVRSFRRTPALPAGGGVWRNLCGGRLFARLRPLIELDLEIRRRGVDCGSGLRRSAAFHPADAAGTGDFLRTGGLCTGAGNAFRRCSRGARRFLHQRGCQGAADCRQRGVCSVQSGFPGRRAKSCEWNPRGCPHSAGRLCGVPDCAARHGERPAESRHRSADFGGGREKNRCSFFGGCAAVSAAADVAKPGGHSGDSQCALPGCVLSPDSVQRGGRFRRTAAGIPQRLGGNRRSKVPAPVGGAVAHGGRRIV